MGASRDLFAFFRFARRPAGLWFALSTFGASDALEKVPHPATPESAHEWQRGCTLTIQYYNFCTGWTWHWSGLGPNEEIGITYHTVSCSDVYWIGGVEMYFPVGAPAGYGYTGAVELRYADWFDCPTGGVITSIPLLPQSGWNYTVLSPAPIPAGPVGYSVVFRNGPAAGSPMKFSTEHPSAGPTGPPACGNCYSPDRVVHSFRFGTPEAPICPGLPFLDGECAAELRWALSGVFEPWTHPATSVPELDTRTWGRVKQMYR